MTDKPYIINPLWKEPFEPVFKSGNERAINWLNLMLFPYIENNLHRFCVELFVHAETLRVQLHTREFRTMGGPTYHMPDEDPTIELVASVVQNEHTRPLIRTIGDNIVTSCRVTHDQFYEPERQVGWRDWNDPELPMQRVNQIKVNRTNYELTLRLDRDGIQGLQHALYARLPLYLYSMHEEMMDVRDWLISGAARIPLTVTKLPWTEAVRMSRKWHEDENRRKQKRKLKDTPRGDREHIGKMHVPKNHDYNIFWLKDQQSLVYESLLQHHCVDGYWPWVVAGNSVILHIANTHPDHETDRWTAELLMMVPEDGREPPRIVLRQMRGIQNHSAPDEVRTPFMNLLTTTGERNERHYMDHKCMERMVALKTRPVNIRGL